MLHAGEGTAGANRLVDRILGSRRPEQRPVARAEPGAGLLIKEYLAHRAQLQFLGRRYRALGCRVEPADRLDFLAEQIETNGIGHLGREYIDDTAAHGVFGRLANRARSVEAVVFEVTQETFGIDRFADRDDKSAAGEEFRRRDTLESCANRCQDDPPRAGGITIDLVGQARRPQALGLPARRNTVVGQAVPRRYFQELDVRCEESQRLGQPRHVRIVAGDMQDRIAAASQRNQC